MHPLPCRRSGREPPRAPQVVLAGGATRMPAVRRMVAALAGVAPRETVNPEACVALGAAIQAGMLVGQARPCAQLPYLHSIPNRNLHPNPAGALVGQACPCAPLASLPGALHGRLSMPAVMALACQGRTPARQPAAEQASPRRPGRVARVGEK